MKRRHKWKAPNNPTSQARLVWAYLFPAEPWPARWRVSWAGFMRNALGLCLYHERRILLSYGDARRGDVMGTLAHEFIHVRAPRFRHGAEFREIENRLRVRLGLTKNA